MGVYNALAYITYSPSERILTKGEDANTLFFLRKGEVVASSTAPRRRLYAMAEVGTYFGERCLFDVDNASQLDSDVAEAIEAAIQAMSEVEYGARTVRAHRDRRVCAHRARAVVARGARSRTSCCDVCCAPCAARCVHAALRRVLLGQVGLAAPHRRVPRAWPPAVVRHRGL
jgi:hypothetical protein